jgi:hypothetical protein
LSAFNFLVVFDDGTGTCYDLKVLLLAAHFHPLYFTPFVSYCIVP